MESSVTLWRTFYLLMLNLILYLNQKVLTKYRHMQNNFKPVKIKPTCWLYFLVDPFRFTF